MQNTIGRGRFLSYALLVLAVSVAAHAQERPQVEAEQGTIARWGGEGTEMCGMDGRTYRAIEAFCYYPVDLKRRPDMVEIARWRNGGPIEKAWLVVKEKEYPLEEIDFPEVRYVTPPPEDLLRHYGEQAQVKPLFRRRRGAPQFTLPLGMPVSPMVWGENFGVRRTFNGIPKNPHTGVDMAVGSGTNVLAVADGTVLLTGEHFFSGNSVYVYHGDGLVSMYFHMSEIKVSAGQAVKQGDTVGLVGSTGRSTGPHLHVGIRWHGARVHPNLLLRDPGALPSVR